MAQARVPLSWLHAIAEISREVNAERPLGELLDLVAEVSCRVTGYDFAAVFRPDQQRTHLLVEGAAGFSLEFRRRLNAERPVHLLTDGPLGGGPAGRAFLSGQPVTVRDIATDATFAPWAGLARQQGYRSVVCMPLVAAGPVGVLTCYTSEVHRFTPTEVALLDTIAEQAAIAIEAAALRARDQARVAELERAEVLRGDLLRVVFEEDGLGPLAESIGRMLGCAVRIDDHAGRRLAGAAEEVEATPAEQRAGVHLAGEAAGVVRALDPAAPFGPLQHRVLEDGALVVALELLKERTAAAVEWRLSADLLTDLLAPEGPFDEQVLLGRADRFGHDLRLPHQLVLVRDPGHPDGLLPMVQRMARESPPRPVVAARGSDAVVLWPVREDRRRGRVLAEALHAEALRAADVHGEPAVAVTGPVQALNRYAEAYRVARGALDLRHAPGVVDVEDLGAERLLLAVRHPEDLRRFALATLGPAVDHDRRRAGDLLATLRAYLDAHRSLAAAATRLHVHPNTVTYRLGRLTELTGVDLADPRQVLDCTLALMVLDITRELPPANQTGRTSPRRSTTA